MPLFLYTLWRVLLFAVVLVLLWWAGLRGWLSVVVAAVVALALAYLFLKGPRDAAAAWLAQRAQRRRATGERFSRDAEADAAYEDAVVDGTEGDDRDR